jgi:hypothetical protein
MSQEEIDNFCDDKNEIYTIINQIMALKQSCYLLRRTSYSCGSLAEDLFNLKLKLIQELKDKHNFDFDDDFVERDGDTHTFTVDGDK